MKDKGPLCLQENGQGDMWARKEHRAARRHGLKPRSVSGCAILRKSLYLLASQCARLYNGRERPLKLCMSMRKGPCFSTAFLSVLCLALIAPGGRTLSVLQLHLLESDVQSHLGPSEMISCCISLTFSFPTRHQICATLSYF